MEKKNQVNTRTTLDEAIELSKALHEFKWKVIEKLRIEKIVNWLLKLMK